jgi:hypothetical protein
VQPPALRLCHHRRRLPRGARVGWTRESAGKGECIEKNNIAKKTRMIS